jgi:hypothetical protein
MRSIKQFTPGIGWIGIFLIKGGSPCLTVFCHAKSLIGRGRWLW